MFTPAQLNQFFLSPLAEAISYNDGTGAVTLRAVVDRSFREEGFSDSEIGSNDPHVWIKTSDIPTVDVLQTLVIRGANYVIESLQDQDDGMTRCFVEPS